MGDAGLISSTVVSSPCYGTQQSLNLKLKTLTPSWGLGFRDYGTFAEPKSPDFLNPEPSLEHARGAQQLLEENRVTEYRLRV